MTAQFQLYKLTGREIWGDADVNGRIRIKWLWKQQDGNMWTGLI